ncbi:MAG: hypothetical protein JJV89_04475, partial [Desulfosarcina sp.]|nr:hypothetical protein [Desulfobacterales bacterium]
MANSFLYEISELENEGETDNINEDVSSTLFGDTSTEPTSRAISTEPDTEDPLSFLDGVWTLAKSIPSLVADVIPSSIGSAIRRGDKELKVTPIDEWINKNNAERERVKTLTPEQKEQTWFKVPFSDVKITHGNLEDAADSLGYS